MILFHKKSVLKNENCDSGEYEEKNSDDYGKTETNLDIIYKII